MTIGLGLALIGATAGAASAVSSPQPTPRLLRLTGLPFERDGAKIAVLADPASRPRRFVVRNAAGRVVLTGRTRVFGASGGVREHVHRIDLSGMRTAGEGFTLAVEGSAPRPFAVAPRPYAPLARAALSFFYQQRSGVPILARHVERPDLARAAGHAPDRAGCFTGTDEQGARWPGCGGLVRNVSGGWYDAGDHGKYVVNGGIAAWTLLDAWARSRGRADLVGDGALALPEAGNGVPDLLDEARVEVEWLLSMQAPAGTRVGVPVAGRMRVIDAGGMAFQKVADARWTGLPTAPADDRETRLLYPPTTAATLNLAAVAAQAARAWRGVDDAFAARALAAALAAWAAAGRHPDVLATSSFTGSGGYGDADLSDEFYWAAAELYATTGGAAYRAALVASPHRLRTIANEPSWGDVATLGTMTLAASPRPEHARARAALVAAADRYVAEGRRDGYGIPRAGTDYEWGSNGGLANRALVLGAAYDLTGRAAYRAAAVDVAEYLTGRNPVDRSYVAGIGDRPMRAPHHRFWAHAADPGYPAPPTGALSGGPNSDLARDPTAPAYLRGCVGQSCWVDDWRLFTVNEVAINWNAPLAWTALFLARTAPRGDTPARTW